MVQYVKASLYSKRDNSFQGNGVFVKVPSDTMPDSAFLHFIYKAADFAGMDGVQSSSPIYFGQHTNFSCATPLKQFRVLTGHKNDSIESYIISERLRSTSEFRNYNIVTGNETFTDETGVFTIDFDDLFTIERREVAINGGSLIKVGYSTELMYSGFFGYHNHNQRGHFNRPMESDGKPYLIGIENEIYAKSNEDYNKITNARTNWFQCERDGSLNQKVYRYTDTDGKVKYKADASGIANLGIELKTIPLRASDATSVDFWAEPMKLLSKHGASKGFSSTGLHVHIGKNILGSNETERQKNLSKLITFYTYYIEDDPIAKAVNKKICGREHGYSDINGPKTAMGDFFSRHHLLGELAGNESAFNEVSDEIKQRCSGQRGDINIKHWSDYGTIEFRRAKGSISSTRLAAVCAWWEQMCLYVVATHPRDFNFNTFLSRVCRDFPAVAAFCPPEIEEC